MDLLIQESEWGQRNSMLEEKDFELLDESPKAEEIVDNETITQDDFTLTQVDSTVHEQKFQTKPTTFFKDSLKRFAKNKSSVVAAYILGGLLLLSFLVPVFDKSDLSSDNPNRAYETYLAPKLFKAGTGFWDGTQKYKNIPVDISAMPEAKTEEEKQQNWWPSSESFPQRSAISKKKFTEEKYTNDLSSFGKEGYVQFGYNDTYKVGEPISFASKVIPSLTLSENLYLTKFDTYDAEKLKVVEGKTNVRLPDEHSLGETALYFLYEGEDEQHQVVTKEVKVVDYAGVHDIGSAVTASKKDKVDLASIIKTETGETTFTNASFAVRMEVTNKKKTCALIKALAFESESTDEDIQKIFTDMSFVDATKALTFGIDDGYKYWSSTGTRNIYLSKAHFCSFVYDTYEAKFGKTEESNFPITTLLKYQKNGWISFKDKDGVDSLWEIEDGDQAGFYFDKDTFTCTILNEEKCPLAKPIEASDFYGYSTPGALQVKATVYKYKMMNYSKVPSYLMGTDKSGRDMFKYVFEGLRTSLLLGFVTFIVCFTFGLIWGSISGYFGGTVDLLMERFTDILTGIPWFVMMTLIVLHMGSDFKTFAIALCATGWVSTASRTRTQFYRFRGREYVLASRTLGASDARLIAKHILPNGLGTIITGSVLMIPDVIFTEASISYLGLGLKGLSSLGVILSDNQAELMTHPFLLLFPAIVIALIEISFNLFGNGLRDAVNPSLKGGE